MQHIRAHVLICGGTGCKSAGSKEVQLAFSRAIEAKGLSDEVMVVETGCHGFCEHGPLVIVYPEGTFYCQVKAEDVEEIVEKIIKFNIFYAIPILGSCKKDML